MFAARHHVPMTEFLHQLRVCEVAFEARQHDARERCRQLRDKYTGEWREAFTALLTRHKGLNLDPKHARDSGTAELRAKPHRLGPVDRLHAKGIVTDEQQRAAVAILRIFETVSGSLMAGHRVMDGTRVQGGTGFTDVRITAEMAWEYTFWFKRWLNGLEHTEAVIDMIVFGRSVYEVRRQHGWGQQRTTTMLVDALDRWLRVKRGTRKPDEFEDS